MGGQPLDGALVELRIRVRTRNNHDVELARLDFGVREVMGAGDLDAGRELNEFTALDSANNWIRGSRLVPLILVDTFHEGPDGDAHSES